MTCHAIMITPAFTLLSGRGGRGVPTPPEVWRGGLGPLLAQLSGYLTPPEGTILLTRSACSALRLPVVTPKAPLDQHPAVDSCRSVGWDIPRDGLRNWTILRSDARPIVYLGILPWIPPDEYALWCDWPADTLGATDLWQDLVGVPYLMTPGVAGLAALRRSYPPTGRIRPTWQVTTGGPPERDAYETVYRRADWAGATDSDDARWSYDANLAGLAAAGCAEVSPWPLKPTGRMAFDRGRAGWWKIEVPPWNDARMPNPVGPDHGTVAWLTTATLTLLAELAEQGVSGGPGFTALDSWTGPARRTLRPWAETMGTAYRSAARMAKLPDSAQWPGCQQDAQRVARAIKQAAAREAIGLMATGTASVRRTDWHHTINATKRANIWRAAWRIGQTTGVWPNWIDDDKIAYPARVPLPLGSRLGQFKETEIDGGHPVRTGTGRHDSSDDSGQLH